MTNEDHALIQTMFTESEQRLSKLITESISNSESKWKVEFKERSEKFDKRINTHCRLIWENSKDIQQNTQGIEQNSRDITKNSELLEKNIKLTASKALELRRIGVLM